MNSLLLYVSNNITTLSISLIIIELFAKRFDLVKYFIFLRNFRDIVELCDYLKQRNVEVLDLSEEMIGDSWVSPKNINDFITERFEAKKSDLIVVPLSQIINFYEVGKFFTLLGPIL